jgi:hypothetical protein
VDYDLASSFNASLAKNWIGDCTTRHSICGPNTPAKLPTRLLHISVAEEAIRVSLREAKPDETGLYACLSYTWGNRPDLQEQFAQLGRSLSETSMSVDNLPQTFRDALEVCRGLGLEYLWVDAVCIRQGDELDKSRELQTMHKYYGNAYVVIQPTGTKSVDEGFLGPTRVPGVARNLQRNHLAASDDGTLAKRESTTPESGPDPDIDFLRVPYTSPDGAQDNIFLYQLAHTSWYTAAGEHAASRGWILQEELLCRRILSFPSVGGMTFRCTGSADMLTDGNVICHPEYHRPLALPKKQLWTDEQIASVGMPPGSDRLRGMVEQARKLAASGTNHPLVFVSGSGDGHLEINHDPSEPITLSEGAFCLAPVYTTSADPTSPPSVSPYAALLLLHNAAESGPPLRATPIFTSLPPHAISAHGALQAWQRTVDDYTRRELSDPRDRLPAIAALAREYAARYGGEDGLGRYGAGLWSKFIPEGLCWKVPWGRTRIQASMEAERAPSWSWAAVEGAKYGSWAEEEEEYDLNSSSVEIKIVGAEMTVKNGLEYESVQRGVFEVRGKTVECSWMSTGQALSLLLEHSTQEPIGKRCYVWPDSNDGTMEEGTLSFLLVQRSNRGIGDHDDCFEGLLLRKQDDGCHIRVGYAAWYSKKTDYEVGLASRFQHEILKIC